MRLLIDLTEKRYGSLTVLERAPNRHKKTMWKCQCDCGNIVDVWGESLKNGTTKSCGCLVRETNKKLHKKHGMRESRLYVIWSGMIERCENKNSNRYENYGEKGIVICKDWRSSFNTFAIWAKSHGYDDNLTIDRIDNSKGYSPQNCRWVTMYEQFRNKTNNHFITINGETKILSDWCNFFGLNRTTVYERIRRGWDEISALTTPVKRSSL